MVAIQDKASSFAADFQKEYDARFIPKAEFVKERERLDDALYDDFVNKLNVMEFQEECYCYRHRKQRPLCHRSDTNFKNSYCSGMGKGASG